MISISQQKDINKIINDLYKLIAEKMEQLNEMKYEIDTNPVFFDFVRAETAGT